MCQTDSSCEVCGQKDGKNLLPLFLFVEKNGLLNLHITSSGAEWLFCQRALYIFFVGAQAIFLLASHAYAQPKVIIGLWCREQHFIRLHSDCFIQVGEHAHFHKYIQQRATILLIWLGCQGCAPSFYSYFNWTHVVRQYQGSPRALLSILEPAQSCKYKRETLSWMLGENVLPGCVCVCVFMG